MIDSIIEILFEEDYSKKVIIYVGGFKPPTKGHFEVVKNALEDFSDADELIIYVGGGVRDNITQEESIKIWDIYKKYLSPKVKIEPSSSPIKSVFDYAKQNPDEEIYWVLGAREGNEGDLADIENRTKSLDKYPNIVLKIITTPGGVSGTKARQALKLKDKEQFFELIPDIEEKEQIWDMVSPIVKEEEITEVVTDTDIICDNCGWDWKIADGGDDLYVCHKCGHDNNPDLEEGKKNKDPKKGTGKKPEGSGRRLYTDEDPKDTVSIKFKTKEDIVNTLNKASFKAKSHARQSQIINLIHQRVRAAYGKAKDPEVKSRLKRALDYIESRKEASKEKTERLRKMKEASDPQAGTALPYGSGFAPVKEAKESNIQDLAYKQIPGLLEKGINYELAHFRGFMRSFYKWSGSKDKNDFFDFIENVKGEIKRVPLSSIKPSQSGNDYKNPSSEYEAEEFQKILDGEESVENHRKEDFYPILVNKRDNKILDGNHRHYALSAINSPYAVVLYVDVPKQYLKEKNDPFGLNEFAKQFVEEVFNEGRNFKEGMVSLTKYMIDNGMNIKPLPKIKVIDNDAENASRLLGKTAHYNPADKSITLYTFGRHPKDILRSFSHEMIHHMQNLEGRLNNITTTNTNEDGDLPEIEKEAYEKGNMMLRNWEDSIKNV